MQATEGDFERTQATERAVQHALEAVKCLGWSVDLQQRGRDLKTTFAQLVLSDQRLCAGIGKGVGAQSKASALWEALEHAFSLCGTPPVLKALPVDLARHDAALVGASPDLTRFPTGEVAISRITFECLADASQTIDFPYFLCDPYFECARDEERQILTALGLRRYGTNSGTASGATWEEAILHGLLEIVERDAVGMALLQSVIREPAKPVNKIVLGSLPDIAKELVSRVEQECSGTVEAWYLVNDVGVPVVLAAVSIRSGDQGSESRYFGSGASLSPTYALERALLEAVQYFHVHASRSELKPKPRKNLVGGLPRFLGCFLEGGFFDYQGGERLIGLPGTDDRLQYLPPAAQVQQIVDFLGNIGVRVYSRTIVNSPVFVTQVVAPHLERFHLVARGVIVAPSLRGRRVLQV